MQQLLDNPFLLLFIGDRDADGALHRLGRDGDRRHPDREVDRTPAIQQGSEPHERHFAPDQPRLVEAAAGPRRRHLDRHRLRLVPGHVLHDAVLARLR